MKKGPKGYSSQEKNPVKAIRKKCYDCSGWSYTEAERCQVKDCPLYPFRKGTNPFRKKKKMTEAQKEAARKRLAEARKKKGN